jgi:hypothetical protein
MEGFYRIFNSNRLYLVTFNIEALERDIYSFMSPFRNGVVGIIDLDATLGDGVLRVIKFAHQKWLREHRVEGRICLDISSPDPLLDGGQLFLAKHIHEFLDHYFKL